MSWMWRRAASWLAVLLMLAGGFSTPIVDAAAQNRPSAAAPMAAKANIQILVIRASNAGNSVDARIPGNLVNKLRNLRFSNFDLLSNIPTRLSDGGESTFPIAGNRRLKINLISKNPTQARVRIRMYNQKGQMFDTTVSIHRNKTFIIGGPSLPAGGVEVIPVTVRY